MVLQQNLTTYLNYQRWVLFEQETNERVRASLDFLFFIFVRTSWLLVAQCCVILCEGVFRVKLIIQHFIALLSEFMLKLKESLRLSFRNERLGSQALKFEYVSFSLIDRGGLFLHETLLHFIVQYKLVNCTEITVFMVLDGLDYLGLAEALVAHFKFHYLIHYLQVYL